MDRRLLGKVKRKRRILDAARARIVNGGVSSLAMRGLAEDAQVSVRTLYNLFGNKDDILDALVAELLAELDLTINGLVLDDPIARCKAIVQVSIDRLIEEQVVYRPVLRAQSRRMEAFREGDERSLAAFRKALEEAVRGRVLTQHVSPETLSHQMYAAHQHNILLWAHGVLDDRQARAAAIHSCALLLMAAGTAKTRNEILSELPDMEKDLTRALASPPLAVSRPRLGLAKI